MKPCYNDVDATLFSTSDHRFLKLIHNIETKLIRRRNVGWEKAKRGTFGFKSKHHLGQLKELDNFENGLLIVVTSLKFRKLNDDFQKKKNKIK